MTTTTAKTLRVIHDEVSAQYLERRAAIEAALITMLAAEHAFFLGLPGTGKSEMSRELLKRVVGDPAWTGPNNEAGRLLWDTQMTRFTPPEKLFGSIDVPALRNAGQYHHKVDGFLPTARFAHVDEIGKTNPAALGAMLSALNERIFHNNAEVMDIPLRTMFACSNEMLTEDDENAAIWDRLLVRVLVDYIQDPGNFIKLMGLGTTPTTAPTTIDYADLAHAVDVEVPAVPVPQGILENLLQLREELRSKGLVPSDRRFRKSRRLLQASAYLHGRSQVEDDDLAVLRYVFWDSVEQIQPVERAVLQLSNPTTKAALDLLDQVEGIAAGIAERKGQASDKLSQYGTEANGKLKQATAKLHKLKQEALAAGRSTTKIDEVEERMLSVKRSIYTECLGMDPALIR